VDHTNIQRNLVDENNNYGILNHRQQMTEYQTMSNPTVAQTILAQLGGHGRLKAMTGANSFVYDDDSLTFRVPKMKNKAKTVVITLQKNDLYTLAFWKITRSYSAVKVEEHTDLFVDSLIETFTQSSGLHLSL
jgi:hypothetical protein